MKRQTHRSSKGPKLYPMKDSKGRFKDIQTYSRAHQRDQDEKLERLVSFYIRGWFDGYQVGRKHAQRYGKVSH